MRVRFGDYLICFPGPAALTHPLRYWLLSRHHHAFTDIPATFTISSWPDDHFSRHHHRQGTVIRWHDDHPAYRSVATRCCCDGLQYGRKPLRTGGPRVRHPPRYLNLKPKILPGLSANFIRSNSSGCFAESQLVLQLPINGCEEL